jgi:hypothetical protein
MLKYNKNNFLRTINLLMQVFIKWYSHTVSQDTVPTENIGVY